MCGQQNGVAGSDRRGSGSIVGNPELIAQVLIKALGRSRPAADASREVVKHWLLDGL
jgi:hypothetical protein